MGRGWLGWLGVMWLCVGMVGVEARSKGEIVLEGLEGDKPTVQRKRSGKVVALLVGINQYQDKRFRSLRYAEKDVKDIRRYLLSMGVKSRDITLLTGKQATLRAIQRALYVWLPKKVGPKDGVFVFFSGHGEKWGAENFIVPYDAEADALQISGLSGAVVERSLNRLRVRQQVLVLDTCFSRAIASEYVAMMENIKPRSNFLPNTHLKRFSGRGRVVFTSSDGAEASLEPKNLGNGLYSHYFLKGLRGAADTDGDKCITAREVHDYVSDKVSAHAQRLGRVQTPAWNPNSTKGILLVRMPGCGQRVASVSSTPSGGGLPSDPPSSGGGWGVLVVSANVGGVEVHVDGAYKAYLRAASRSKRLRLKSGRHEVVLKKRGYAEQRVVVDLDSGAELPLEGALVKNAAVVVDRPSPPRRRISVASAQSTQGRTPRAGTRKTFSAGGATFAMRWIPAGILKPRGVRISKGFWMLETEVTQGQYEALMGSNPSEFKNCGKKCPVEQVSWHDARAFANKLSDAQGLAVCTATDEEIFKCTGWRLPTEAEWEYAARAGTKGERYGAPNEIAWWGAWTGNGNSQVSYEGVREWYGKKWGTHPVRGKWANRWGLYDMLGNVWEWTVDVYGPYAGLSMQDPLRSSGATERVLRGGCWLGSAKNVSSAIRNRVAPTYRTRILGFRLLRR